MDSVYLISLIVGGFFVLLSIFGGTDHESDSDVDTDFDHDFDADLDADVPPRQGIVLMHSFSTWVNTNLANLHSVELTPSPKPLR